MYLQACKGQTPVRSAVVGFGFAIATPAAGIAAGASVNRFQQYRPQIWTGWAIALIGCGLFSRVGVNTSVARIIGYEILFGAGFGLIFAGLYFPVLAPQKLSTVSYALGFYYFLRQFSQVSLVTACLFPDKRFISLRRSGVLPLVVQSFRTSSPKLYPTHSRILSMATLCSISCRR